MTLVNLTQYGSGSGKVIGIVIAVVVIIVIVVVIIVVETNKSTPTPTPNDAGSDDAGSGSGSGSGSNVTTCTGGNIQTTEEAKNTCKTIGDGWDLCSSSQYKNNSTDKGCVYSWIDGEEPVGACMDEGDFVSGTINEENLGGGNGLSDAACCNVTPFSTDYQVVNCTKLAQKDETYSKSMCSTDNITTTDDAKAICKNRGDGWQLCTTSEFQDHSTDKGCVYSWVDWDSTQDYPYTYGASGACMDEGNLVSSAVNETNLGHGKGLGTAACCHVSSDNSIDDIMLKVVPN